MQDMSIRSTQSKNDTNNQSGILPRSTTIPLSAVQIAHQDSSITRDCYKGDRKSCATPTQPNTPLQKHQGIRKSLINVFSVTYMVANGYFIRVKVFPQ